MAFFKFRKGGDGPALSPPESIEAMRRRARYRLTGAAVLVLLGVIGFPLLFDTQPRPVAVDIPIDIPDRNKVKPLGEPVSTGAAPAPAIPDPVIATGPAASPPAVPASPAAASALPGVANKKETAAEGKGEANAEAKSETKADNKAEPKTESKADTKSAKAALAADIEATKAKGLLEGKPADAAAAAGESRFVVQVGAFADAAKAQDTRLKVERTGLKTYTHVAETKEGKRTRVRVGPFATRSEADKAAAKIKGLDLPAAVLTL